MEATLRLLITCLARVALAEGNLLVVVAGTVDEMCCILGLTEGRQRHMGPQLHGTAGMNLY